MGILDYSINAVDDDFVQIDIKEKDWEMIQQKLDFLGALEAHGVDNWDGYSDAYRSVYGGDDEEDL